MGTGLEDMRMPENDADGVKRALVISAHPDDSEFGAGGTARLWTRDGWEFHYLICTDGSKGTEDPEMTPEKLTPRRREEQKAAARVVGVEEVSFLNYVDGEVRYDREVLRDIVRHIRFIKPYAVFTHDPNQIVRNMFFNHPDHRAVGEMTIDAVYPIARNRPSFPELLEEGLEPFSVKEVYLWTASDVNFEVDISEVLETKIDALRQHASQFDNFDEMEQRVRQFWKEPDGRYLERFRRIVLPF
jgi:LmbE family N-acetylglucosaminyl deacetylase